MIIYAGVVVGTRGGMVYNIEVVLGVAVEFLVLEVKLKFKSATFQMLVTADIDFSVPTGDHDYFSDRLHSPAME